MNETPLMKVNSTYKLLKYIAYIFLLPKCGLKTRINFKTDKLCPRVQKAMLKGKGWQFEPQQDYQKQFQSIYMNERKRKWGYQHKSLNQQHNK